MFSTFRGFQTCDPPVIRDPNTVSLLHFDGANGATTYTDACGVSWTNNGLSISTAQLKFGSGSLACTGGSNSIYSSGTSTFNIYGKQFTCEFWYRPNSINSGLYNTLVIQRLNLTDFCPIYLYQLDTSMGWLSSDLNNQTWNVNSSASGIFTTASVWYHIALSVTSSTARLFVNGTQVGSYANQSWKSSNYPMAIGGQPSYGASGYIDEFRFLNGTAKYTANFTPPALPFGV